MDRHELEKKGLTKDMIDFVMAENGKDVQAEQAKAKADIATAVKPLNEQVAELTKQNKEFQETIKSTAGVDASAKAEIERLQKEHEAKIKEIQKAHDDKFQALKREADTKEFIRGLGKKFVTPETEKVFEDRLNAALADKAYEGKNRDDILAVLTLGADGKERTDIYAASTDTKPPAATGATGGAPEGGGKPKPVPVLI